MQKWTPTEVFLHLARPNVFSTGSNDAKMKADRSFFCAWRDRTLLRLARTMQKLTPTEMFSRLVRPNIFSTGTAEAQLSTNRNYLATEVTEARMAADRNFLATGAAGAQVLPTDFFLHLAQPNVLTTGANNVK